MVLSNIPKNLVVCLDILWDQVLKVFHGFIYMYMHLCFHVCFVFSCYVWMFWMYVKCIHMYVFLHMYICICVYICVHQCAYMLCVYVCVGTHFCSYKSYLIFCLVDIQVIQISASWFDIAIWVVSQHSLLNSKIGIQPYIQNSLFTYLSILSYLSMISMGWTHRCPQCLLPHRLIMCIICVIVPCF